MKVLSFRGCRLRVGGDETLGEGSRARPHGVFVIASPGAPFQRSQLPHATSCRHFHLGPPQPQQLAPDFPLAHPVQSQPGLSAHMAPAHQHSGALHQSLTPLPTLQFQDVTGPSFLPQALHQQYLLQQQLLEAQHRRLVSHPRCVRHVGEGGGAGAGPGARPLVSTLPGLASRQSPKESPCRRQLLLWLEAFIPGSEHGFNLTPVPSVASVCPCHMALVAGLGWSRWTFA